MNQSIQRYRDASAKPENTLGETVPTDNVLDISSYVDFVVDNRWVIALVFTTCALVGTTYAFLAKPIFEANILVQVSENGPAPRNMLGDLTAVFDTRTQAATEAEVIRSRSVVSPAVEKWRLHISAEPKRLALIGSLAARFNKHLSNPGLLGQGGYAWGAEKISVPVFNVPEALEGEKFTLTVIDHGQFRVTTENTGISFRGKVGEPLRIASAEGEIEILVEQLLGKPGVQFLITRHAHLQAVEKLQSALKVSERGKQSGVIGVSLEGSDAQKTSAVLNEIGREYIRQNMARKSEEAEKTRGFFTEQLPAMKKELERSEARYNELRHRRGTIDLGEEAKTTLQQSAVIETKLIELNQKKKELMSRYTENHPSIEMIDRQMEELKREASGIEGKIKKRPAVEQEVFRLERDLRVNTEVYTGLLGMAQQLRLVEANKAGNVRLLDTAAKPVKPVRPNRPAIIAIACAAGLVLALMAAFARKLLFRGVDDPRALERYLGVPVRAVIPHSETQEKLHAQLQNGSKKVLLLPHDTPADSVVESLRAFRTSLQFAMRDAKSNVIMITGPSARAGKSFISANFAAVLAATGKKVLLIDADLHLGHLHRYFGVAQKDGLTESITGKALPVHVIHKDVVKGVDFISTGSLVNKPAEMLEHPNFGKLLQYLSPQYDHVLIDTPPVLAFADAMIVGLHAEAIFSVVRSGLNGLAQVEESANRLNQAGLAVTGIVFNDLDLYSSRYGYGARYGAALS